MNEWEEGKEAEKEARKEGGKKQRREQETNWRENFSSLENSYISLYKLQSAVAIQANFSYDFGVYNFKNK